MDIDKFKRRFYSEFIKRVLLITTDCSFEKYQFKVLELRIQLVEEIHDEMCDCRKKEHVKDRIFKLEFNN